MARDTEGTSKHAADIGRSAAGSRVHGLSGSAANCGSGTRGSLRRFHGLTGPPVCRLAVRTASADRLRTSVIAPRDREPTGTMADAVYTCVRSFVWQKQPPRNPRPSALSLHLGLNAVDPVHYGGWSGELAACERDATDMAALAKAQKMKPTVLLTKQRHPGQDDRRDERCRQGPQERRPLLPDLLRPWRPGARRHRRGDRQAGRDLVPLRQPADRRRAVFRAGEVRLRRAHPGAVGQLPQRHGHPRRAWRPASADSARG